MDAKSLYVIAEKAADQVTTDLPLGSYNLNEETRKNETLVNAITKMRDAEYDDYDEQIKAIKDTRGANCDGMSVLAYYYIEKFCLAAKAKDVRYSRVRTNDFHVAVILSSNETGRFVWIQNKKTGSKQLKGSLRMLGDLSSLIICDPWLKQFDKSSGAYMYDEYIKAYETHQKGNPEPFFKLWFWSY